MRFLAVYATVILASCPFQAARAQAPLPAAKHGQPAFSFEGGKRVSVQNSRPAGMREYGSAPASPGTGIVEVGNSGLPARIGTRATILRDGDPAAPGSAVDVGPDGKFISVSKSAGAKSAITRTKVKAATTVVKIPAADGTYEYKEVPFMGEVSSNKRASNVVDVKDGAGQVKEYDWAAKRK
jgi:hypothetical protein